MYRFGSLYFAAAIGEVLHLLTYFHNRSGGPPYRPLKVPLLLAVLAGSRPSYLDCFNFATQVAAVSLPNWHFSLNLRPDIELKGNPFVYDPFWLGLGTGVFVNYLCKLIARRRLKSAEYVMLKGRFLSWPEGEHLPERKTICHHGGYQEPAWNFRDVRFVLGLKKPSVGYAASGRGDITFVVPSESLFENSPKLPS